MTLFHIKSDGKSDSYHFIWSFVGAPSLLMARTPLNSVLKVDWTQLFTQESTLPSITLDPPAFYSFGWSLVKVFIREKARDTKKIFMYLLLFVTDLGSR
jgi:hypothetical protein